MKRVLPLMAFCLFFLSGNCMELNIRVEKPGNLINQIDVATVEDVDSITLSGDLNGTDILVIRKMCNLSYIDMRNANIVNGGQSYHENYVVSENTIGSYFFNTTKKVKIFLPNSVTTIKPNCLDNCLEEVDLTIGENTESIGYAFSGSRISTVKLPNNIKSIGSYAFSECRDLKEIYLPNSVGSIEWGAFYGCFNLAKIRIGSKLKEIDINAFNGVGVEEIEIEDLSAWLNINFRGGSSPASYSGNTKLVLSGEPIVDLVIPDGIDSIKQNAFYGISIESATLPSSLKFIGESAFGRCVNLKSITMGDNVEEIQTASFSESDISEIKLPLNLSYIAEYLFCGCEKLKKVIIPQGITSIGEHAFEDCINLTEISIPSSVTEIGFKAFADCKSLNNLYFEDGSEELTLEGGRQGSSSKYAYYTFYNAPIRNVYVGRNLKRGYCNDMSKTPFDGTNITELCYGNSVTTVNRLFGYFRERYPYLTKVSFGENVKEIEEYAFEPCVNIVNVTSLNSVPPLITNETFNETIYQKATLYIPKGCKTNYWLDPVWGKFQQIEEIEYTNVENILTDSEDSCSAYTLSGVKIPISSIKLLYTLPKGIYIVNGKKVLIR
ncbi:MAG: leucine-rich repeat domain-containing protein [Bacteroidaceae bacterium]|nr:leucine-rich repeat domain-containing protein [Bacteroidaceae bacterium]